jgi:hypothetical protein
MRAGEDQAGAVGGSLPEQAAPWHSYVTDRSPSFGVGGVGRSGGGSDRGRPEIGASGAMVNLVWQALQVTTFPAAHTASLSCAPGSVQIVYSFADSQCFLGFAHPRSSLQKAVLTQPLGQLQSQAVQDSFLLRIRSRHPPQNQFLTRRRLQFDVADLDLAQFTQRHLGRHRTR